MIKNSKTLLFKIGLFLGLLTLSCSAENQGTTFTGAEGKLSPQQMVNYCNNASVSGTVTTITQTLQFPRTNNSCQWGTNGNLQRQDRVTTARLRQDRMINLGQPARALCALHFDIPPQPMRFDDELLLLLDQYVLASSHDFAGPEFLNPFMIDQDGFEIYDWQRLRGDQNFGRAGFIWPPYCLGMMAGANQSDPMRCNIPLTQTDGQMIISIPDEAAIRLGDKVMRTSSTLSMIPFAMVITGDNDDSDCSHLDFQMTVTASVIY